MDDCVENKISELTATLAEIKAKQQIFNQEFRELQEENRRLREALAQRAASDYTVLLN